MATTKKTEAADRTPTLGLKQVRVTLKGTRPLLMHCGDLADPMNVHAKALKALTSSGKKGAASDDKENAKARIEYEGGLWLDESGMPCVPGEAIEAMIRDSGKLQKMGTALKRAVRCDDDFARLSYDGDKGVKSVADLMKKYDADPTATALRKRVKMPGAGTSVMRTRPRFKDWSITFTLSVVVGADVDLAHVKTALDMGGSLIGLGDWHGRYGLFAVEKFAEV